MQNKKLTGYPSIDKPWLKYYSEEAIEASIPQCTAYDYLWESNKNNLENVALNYFDRLISFKELFDSIEKCTKALSAIGLKSGDIIIMTTVTVPETIYAFYACNRLGIISNMVDPRTSIEGIRNYINEVGARCIITIDIAYSKIEKASKDTCVEKIIVIDPLDSISQIKRVGIKLISLIKRSAVHIPDTCDKWRKFLAHGENTSYFLEPYKENTCCVIVHTGGTTGTPKSVMLSNENLNTMALQYRLLGAEFNNNQNFLNIMPPFIAYGVVCGIHMPLVLGLTDVLVPQFNSDEFADLVIKYKPAHILGVPTHFEKMIQSPKMHCADLSFLESAGAGGDSVSAKFEQDINAFLHEHNSKYEIAKGYGMTEISSAAVTCHGTINKFQSVGIPHLKTVVSIFKPGTDEEQKYGKNGEICMTAPTVMLGYYNQPEETSKVLRKHSDGNWWLHSGDIGYMDKDGFLFIDGRIKRMIVRYDGFKVFPSMIENAISSHPAVEQCCVVGIDDVAHIQGKLPSAYIVLKGEYHGNENKTKQELDKLCKKNLPKYAHPIAWHFVDNLPVTPIGKIDYRTLEMKANV